jgi:hypothetical protein
MNEIEVETHRFITLVWLRIAFKGSNRCRRSGIDSKSVGGKIISPTIAMLSRLRDVRSYVYQFCKCVKQIP